MNENDVLIKIAKSMNRQSSRRGGIHVSHLYGDCLRKSYYGLMHPEQFHSLRTLMTFWVGRQLHDTKVFKQSEIPLEYDGVVGTCDEYEDGVLLEKKTCTTLPKSVSKAHKTQCEYYALMLGKAGKPVKQAFVAYLDVANKDIKVFKVDLRKDEDIEPELMSRKEALEMALKNKQPPARSPSWLCNYCNFASVCFGDGNAK